MNNLPRHLKLNLAPLLLSLAVSQSYAVEVIVAGEGGVAGMAGATLGAAGTAGTSATAVNGGASHAQAGALQLSVSGGAGGAGGRGGPISEAVFAGDGGNGGAGAAAAGRAALMAGALDVAVQALVAGGNGGQGGTAGGVDSEFDYPSMYAPYDPNPSLGRAGIAGHGGNAASEARAVTGGAGNVEVKAVARGGNGGSVAGRSGVGGAGGAAVGSAYGQSGSGKVSVTAEVYGGNGGDGDIWHRSGGGAGAGVTLVDVVAGRTSGALSLVQQAVGGSAGSGGEAFDATGAPLVGAPVAAGAAVSRLTLGDDAASGITAVVSAQGGNGGALIGPSLRGQSPEGGAASAALTLASTRAGAALDGTVFVRGGGGGGVWTDATGVGGRAEAVGQLTGRGDVRGSATALGGGGGATGWEGAPFGGAVGGDASATLSLAGAGMVSGSALAQGGQQGQGYTYFGTLARGAADATLTLSGAGAQGSAVADGANARSAVSARTSGALAVEVNATSHAGYSEAVASVDVISGAGLPRGGASVAAAARATSEDGLWSAPVSARVDVQAAGAINATSDARSGNSNYQTAYSDPASSGYADSSVRGVTSGEHAVTLSATARAGDTRFGVVDFFNTSAGASARALGQSGRGDVDVLASARASGGVRAFAFEAYGRASASATAVNLERGGRGIARAVVWGGSGEVLASASGIDQRGGTVRVSGAAATLPSQAWDRDLARSIDGSAVASNYFDAAAFRLAGYTGAAQMVSNVGAGPDSVDAVAGLGLGLGPVLAGAMPSLAGVGMQALGSDVPGASAWTDAPSLLAASGRFEFDGAAGRHLLLGLVSSSFSGAFDSLELSITNHGVALFSRLFTDAGEARLFFSDRLLDLGLLGAGMQDVLVSTVYASYEPGGFAFNYVVGAGVGVTAVPEASTWLMLVLGLGAVTIVARRRRAARASTAC